MFDVLLNFAHVVHLFEFELQEHFFNVVFAHHVFQEVLLHLNFLREYPLLSFDPVAIDELFNYGFHEIVKLVFDVVFTVFEFVLKGDELLQEVLKVAAH